MIRQRVRLRRGAVIDLVRRLLASLVGVGLVFYGAMTALAALKLRPSTLDRLSAYRTIYHRLASVTAAQITTGDRLIVAGAGLLTAIVFGRLAWRALPRPYLARTSVEAVAHGDAGSTEVAPRAVERIAEVAAARPAEVQSPSARYGAGAVEVRVKLRSTDELITQLTAVQARVGDGLRDHGLSDETTIDVTFGGVES